jgi:hypothetical protein
MTPVLCAVLLSRCAVGTGQSSPSLDELRIAYKKDFAAISQFYHAGEQTGRLRITGLAGTPKEVSREFQMRVLRSGKAMRIDRQVLSSPTKPAFHARVVLLTESRVFELQKPANDAEYALVYSGEDRSYVQPDVLDMQFVFEAAFRLTFATVADILLGNDFTVDSVSSQNDGPTPLVRVDFHLIRRPNPHGDIRRDGTPERGFLVLSKPHFHRLERFEFRAVRGDKFKGTITYGDSDGAEPPVPRFVAIEIEQEGAVARYEFELESSQSKPIDAGHFKLATFGMPSLDSPPAQPTNSAYGAYLLLGTSVVAAFAAYALHRKARGSPP